MHPRQHTRTRWRYWQSAVLVVLVVLWTHAATGQAVWEPGVRGEPIPKEGYQSWSLFLVCNPAWLLPEHQEMLLNLYRQFKAFGNAIGPQHLAVWLWKQQPRWRTPDWVEDIDVERSSEYCAKYGLLPSKSPHVLVTTSYPDLAAAIGNYSTLELNEVPARDITALLTTLADQLLVQGLRQADLDSEAYWRAWQRSFEAIGSAFASFMTKVKFTINTAFFKIEIDGGAR
jgi:hypothetical protein